MREFRKVKGSPEIRMVTTRRRLRIRGPAILFTIVLTSLIGAGPTQTTSANGEQTDMAGSFARVGGQSAQFRARFANLTPIAPAHRIGHLQQLPPFRFVGGMSSKDQAVKCMAQAVYYEAGDDTDGQTAVAQVVLNRVRHPSYPDSICAVVFEGSHRQTGCQFTFTCDGSMSRVPNAGAWRRALSVARGAIDGAGDKRVGTATHYHADYVMPYWSSGLDRLSTIGRHIFYRFPGRPGSPIVFSQSNRGEERMAIVAPRLDGDVALDREVFIATQSNFPANGGPDGNMAEGLNGQIRTRAKNAHFVDVSVPPGRWAVSAMAACGVKPNCLYVGYRNDPPANSGHALGQGDRPAFVLVKDGKSGMSAAYWDCTIVARDKVSECLPQEPARLAYLLRPRN